MFNKNQAFLDFIDKMRNNNSSNNNTNVLNYKINKPDSRDYVYRLTTSPIVSKSYNIKDFYKKDINVYTQGNIGSCVSNSFALSVSILSKNTISLSRLFHYYCGRSLDGNSSITDDGLSIREAANIISKYGVVEETYWPYEDITKRFKSLPPLIAFQKSQPLTDYKYSFLKQNINEIKDSLSNKNRPIIFGIMVYSSFMTSLVTKTGLIPMPNTQTEKSLGGHCITMIGFDDVSKTVTCVNSWGTSWGINGTFKLPYDYVLNTILAIDFCTISFLIK